MKPHDESDPQGLTNNSDNDGIILSEDSLRKLCKSLTDTIPKDGHKVDGADLLHLQSLHDELLRTASSTKLSLTHGAAALNSLCGFLEQCHQSADPEINALPFTFQSWTEAFHIFLTTTANNKAKPIRRLLLTLTSLLSKHPADGVKLSLIAHAISVATRAIRGQDEVASIKAAIQVLEHLLTTRFTDALDVVQGIAPQQLRSSLASPAARSTDASRCVDAIQNFTLSVLEWVQYPDCAPAVGRFLPAFFISFKDLQSQEVAHGLADGSLPLWISPVRQSLERRHNLLEVYENHVLPGLLRLSPADRKGFLSTLPLDEIQKGNSGKFTIAEIQLCILVAKISLSTKPERASEETIQKPKDTKEVDRLQAGVKTLNAEEERIDIDAECLGMNLLEHASPAIRISAFALLASYPSTTRPFSRDILSCLQRFIPFFHVEVSAKARNEFIASMKKLCVRLRGTIVSPVRDRQDSFSAYPDPKTAGMPPADASGVVQKGHVILRHLQIHLNFYLWFIRFLTHELQPTASYQGHITALKILHPLLEGNLLLRANSSKANEQYIKLFNKELSPSLLLRPLLDLLLDPFDDVRQVANMVIDIQLSNRHIPLLPKPNGEASREAQSIENEVGLYDVKSVIYATLKRAESKAAETGRADHADGVGRLYSLLYGFDNAVAILDQLLFTLEEEVDVAKKDLLLAINNAPLHGHLIALRHITSRPDYWFVLIASTPHGGDIWTDHNERIMAICNSVWEAVRDVLCFDAPEGNIVTDEEVGDVGLGTKDTLSYCWRALKESSSLMHSIITNKHYSPLPYDACINFERFGHLSLKQLGELRHRGAFSTVSLTFAACCTACAQSHNPRLIQMQKGWYQEALACMAQNASSLTRRSAGLPAMITGILAAYPSGDFFNNVVFDLQAIADGPISDSLDSNDAQLPQVHALNCLKDIFTDARFGASTEAHVADTVSIAASCLESHEWAIRNCGLMLFKALLRRLNGGTDTASTKLSSSYRRSSNVTYEKCPNLAGLLIDLLGSRNSSDATTLQSSLGGSASSLTMRNQSVFAALEVIEKSGVPPGHAAEILDLLWGYAGCPDWSLREKAAKALSPMMDDHSVEGEVRRLLSSDWKSQNVLHGRLLYLRFVFGRAEAPLFGNSLSAYERLLPLLDEHLDDMTIRNHCPITAAAFLDCMIELIMVLIRSRSTAVCSSLFCSRDILPWLEGSRHSPKETALALHTRAMARYRLLDVLIVNSHVHNKQDAAVKTIDQLPQRHLDAVVAIVEMQQYVSDENILATLSHTSSHELQYASRALQFTGWDPLDQSRLPSNPREADFALALSGYSQGTAYRRDPGEFSIESRLKLWIHRLQLAGFEHAEIRTRSAAVFSLRGFFEALLENNLKPKPEPELLEVYLALYNTLLDDDEDVRDQGATTVSIILSAIESKPLTDSAPSLSLSPPAASQRLMSFMEEGYRMSTSMYMRAAERLVGLQLSVGTYSKGGDDTKAVRKAKLLPVAEISLKAQMPQLAVFVEEKQNLYIDTVKEAEIWAGILIRLHSDTCISEVAEALEVWTTDGLSHFLGNLKQGGDSAFGPTSIPEVFTLFIRVIVLARVILARSVPALGEGHVKYNPCVGLLEELLEVGKKRNLHSLLTDHIQRILQSKESIDS